MELHAAWMIATKESHTAVVLNLGSTIAHLGVGQGVEHRICTLFPGDVKCYQGRELVYGGTLAEGRLRTVRLVGLHKEMSSGRLLYLLVAMT